MSMPFRLESNKKFVLCFNGSVDDNSWQGEAKIDMDYFHQVYKSILVLPRSLTTCPFGKSVFLIDFSFASQNHLIVMVPPFHNQSVTSPVTVGIFVMTNAGRSNEAQTFTYIPDSGTAVLSKRPSSFLL